MNTEEKAKAYDKAIEKARKELQACGSNNCDAARQIFRLFPELKESEDEKIRKAILSYLKKMWGNCKDNVCGVHIEDAISWLEKQGEQKTYSWKPTEEQFEALDYAYNSCSDTERGNYYEGILETLIKDLHRLEKQSETFTKKDVDDAYLKGVSDTKNEMEKQYEANYQIRKDIATFIFNYRGVLKDRAKWMDYLGIKAYFVQEQDEQKPSDKVEQKFHEDDWVVTDKGDTIQIATVNPGYYILNNGMEFSKSYVDKYWHLWTIEDAKDGDVLANDKSVFIYAKVLYNKPYAYCGVDKFGVFKDNCLKYDWSNSVDNIHPATKEQRDALFTKMKEAGYEWDAEKKELKIVDWGKHIKYNPNAPSITKEKPTWSEEDEKKLSDILAILRGGENCYYNSHILIDWLKSIKERIGG